MKHKSAGSEQGPRPGVAGAAGVTPKAGVARIAGVDFTSVRLADDFWAPLVRTSARTTIPVCLDRCEETGRIANFKNAALRRSGEAGGGFEGIYYNDSDVYKVLEGVAYNLHHDRSPALETRADAVIQAIAASQWPDGYLNSYYTLTGPEKRWTDMGMHEDYCLGHMLEAGVAYARATGKHTLQDVCIRAAAHLAATFGPGKRPWVAGHQEIELALVKLSHATGAKSLVDLSRWYLEQRGRGLGKGFVWERAGWGPAYCQDDRPVSQMEGIAGHAVRAMYLYAAMADVVAEQGAADYFRALERLWDSTVNRNMYVTGGIGSSEANEGFTKDYDLPNDTAYCETCASVGMVLWNHRMFLLSGHARYAEVVERCMYNGSLAGVSLAGDTFFYANPMESDGSRHRKPWFDCSCCPTQIARFIPAVGGYLYAVSADTLWVNLYVQGDATVSVAGASVRVEQRTGQPWDGPVTLRVHPDRPSSFTLALRVPSWSPAAGVGVNVNGAPVRAARADADGYVRITRTWQAGDVVEVNLSLEVVREHADPRVTVNAGRVALRRGPLIYCFEECDNPGFGKLHVSPKARFDVRRAAGLPDGTRSLEVLNPDGSRFTAVPYYAWDNRAAGAMKVWVDESDQDGRA